MPSDRIPALLKWSHKSSGHVRANRTLKLLKKWFHSMWSDDQLQKTLQPLGDKGPCRSCKPGDIRDGAPHCTLPIEQCDNSVLYVDYKKTFRGYNFALVLTCALTRFIRVSTWIPYTNNSNPIFEQQTPFLKEDLRICGNIKCTKDWVRPSPIISLMMNSQETSATGYSPHELFMGCPALILHTPYPEDSYFTAKKLVKIQQDKVEKAMGML